MLSKVHEKVKYIDLDKQVALEAEAARIADMYRALYKEGKLPPTTIAELEAFPEWTWE